MTMPLLLQRHGTEGAGSAMPAPEQTRHHDPGPRSPVSERTQRNRKCAQTYIPEKRLCPNKEKPRTRWLNAEFHCMLKGLM